MRQLTGHRVNPANDKLEIHVTDERGAGGASHRYEITGYAGMENPANIGERAPHMERTVIVFQNGPIAESGVNGVTQEALLEICADRLRSFQKGQYQCRENALALTKIEEAQLWLHKRTMDRMGRNVEGTHTI